MVRELGLGGTGIVYAVEVKARFGRTGPALEDPSFPVIPPEFQSIRNDPEFRELFKLGG